MAEAKREKLLVIRQLKQTANELVLVRLPWEKDANFTIPFLLRTFVKLRTI